MKLIKPIILTTVLVSAFSLGSVLSPTKLTEASDGGSVACREGNTAYLDESGNMLCKSAYVEVGDVQVVPSAAPQAPVTVPEHKTDKTPSCTP